MAEIKGMKSYLLTIKQEAVRLFFEEGKTVQLVTETIKASMENFFGSLKTECIYRHQLTTLTQLES